MKTMRIVNPVMLCVVACGGNVVDGSGNEAQGGSWNNIVSVGGGQNIVAPSATGGTQASSGITTASGGVAGSSLTGGMTLIPNTGAIEEGMPPSCEWDGSSPGYSDCTLWEPSNDAGAAR